METDWPSLYIPPGHAGYDIAALLDLLYEEKKPEGYNRAMWRKKKKTKKGY